MRGIDIADQIDAAGGPLLGRLHYEVREREMLLLILILALIWIFSWSGPRDYPAYADRYNRYPLWGGRSHILLGDIAYSTSALDARRRPTVINRM